MIKSVLYRGLIGYIGGDKKRPVYEAMPGALVTRAFIHCSQCSKAISHNMGPHRDTWCAECTEKQ